MSITPPRGGPAPTPASIKRVILRGLIATYLVTLLAVAGTVVHVMSRFGSAGADLLPFGLAILGPACCILVVMVVVSRRADRITLALEDDRRQIGRAHV